MARKPQNGSGKASSSEMESSSKESGNNKKYEVGYGKPPRHTQFAPGKSGNPRGRDKGSRGLKTDFQKELAATHSIQINGRPVKGTRQQLMAMALTARAASGDLKAAALLIPLVQQMFGFDDRGTDKERLSPQDQELLDFMLDFGSGDGLRSPEEVGERGADVDASTGPDKEGTNAADGDGDIEEQANHD